MKVIFVDQAGSLYGSEKGLLALLGRPRPADFTPILVSRRGDLWDAVEGLVEAREELEFGGYGWLRRPDWQLLFLARFLKILRRRRPEAVVINYEGNVPLLVLGCALARVPAVRMLKREVRTREAAGADYRLTATDEWSFKLCAGVVCISGAVERQLREAIQAGTDFKAVTLYDPQEPVEFSAAEALRRRRELGVRDDEFLVGQFARVHPEKGFDTFIRAAALVSASLPNARFAVVGAGDPSYVEELKRLTHELNVADKFIWAGFVPGATLVMAACDVTALATRAEGLGRVIIESWAVGRAVAASDTGGPGEVIRLSGGGLLHPVGDHGALAENLLRLLSDEALRKDLAGRGRDWMRSNCDPVSYRERFVEHLRGFVDDRKHAGRRLAAQPS